MAGKKIDVNTAGIEELESLSGIGQARAEKIIEVRKVTLDCICLELWMFWPYHINVMHIHVFDTSKKFDSVTERNSEQLGCYNLYLYL